MRPRKSVLLMVGLTIMNLFFVNLNELNASTSQSAVLFLRIAAGARAAGMGESFVAIADDATATHWNPAGLGLYPLSSTWVEYPLEETVKYVLPEDQTVTQVSQLFAASADPEKIKILSERIRSYNKLKSDHLSQGSVVYIFRNAALKALALTRNDIPDDNYRRFDVWGITDLDLFKWDGISWKNWDNYKLGGQGIEDLLKEITGVQEKEKLSELQEQVAAFNSGVSKAELQSLTASLNSLMADDYSHRLELKSLLNDVLVSWGKTALIKTNFLDFLQLTRQALSDSQLSRIEADKILFGLEKSMLKGGVGDVNIPYRILFQDSLTGLVSDDEKSLWVGTKNGLYTYDKNRWKRMGKAEGLLSENITALGSVSGDNRVWIATDLGLVRFDGRTFTTLDYAQERQEDPIQAVVIKNDRDIWLASRQNIFHYDGTFWETNSKYTVKVGDDLEKVAKKFLGNEGDKKVALTIQFIKEVNKLTDDNIKPAQVLKIPYALALEGAITAITIDKKGNLWVGTEMGVKRFDGERWFGFGYLKYVVVEDQTVDQVATKFLTSPDPEKIKILSERIRTYNKLESDSLIKGSVIYIYRNVAGSRILSLLAPNGEDCYVGTEFGTLKYSGGIWNRYYHAGLDGAKTYSMIYKDGEIWFSSEKKIVVYAHAKNEATFMLAKWLPELASDLYYVYASYVHPLEGWGTIGGNITYLSLGQSIRTDEFGNDLGVFDSYDFALTLSYGTLFSPNLALGMNAKLIISNLSAVGAGREQGSGRGNSFAVDAGFIYRTYRNKLTLAAALTNVGPDITYIDADQSDPLPRNLAVGVAYKLFDTPYNRLTATFEVNKELVGVKDDISTEFDEAIENMGLEYWYGSYVAFRAGYIYDRTGDVKTPTFGASLQYTNYHFDFAYIPYRPGLALSNQMRFSITAKF